MWNASSDDSGSVEYMVFRDGQQIARTGMTMFTDTGLTAGSDYSYTVKAVDLAGNVSAASNVLDVSTQAALEPQPAPEPAPTPGGTWDPRGSYAAGDTVTYGGQIYRAVQSHTGIGDPNWITAPSLWVAVDDAPAPAPEPQPTPEPEPAPVAGAWNPTGAYSAGDRVTFDGASYEAVQSHTGNGDPNWIYAPSLWQRV
jgi:chitodextrinase